MVLSAWQSTLLRWPAVVGLLLCVMLFVPVGRYTIPINLPFGLELYRLAVAVVLAAWVDPPGRPECSTASKPFSGFAADNSPRDVRLDHPQRRTRDAARVEPC